ncbi:MAG TPA: EAL domain-containing protein [Steroidobacteraceae bacterium]|jgi:EAL domain-containing protein (putative c-di-GMP-specific phosphodiesterase class I)/CheY-like chemotaxis protein|nr:EAL domain-containing protein [Steroidobacteraceae bacterium]
MSGTGLRGPARPVVMCVDDEPGVLEGLRALLGRKYPVITAADGKSALALLERHPDVAVILSDMRMPGIDGIEFLARCCSLVPRAQRIMLTGQADLSIAMSAVNRGQVFRFLTKPCSSPQLLEAVAAAAARYTELDTEMGATRQAAEVRQSHGDFAGTADNPESLEFDDRALLYDLLDAIRQDRLELHYQPVIDVEIGAVRSFEGLARWRHERIGYVPPTQFVALAERGGEIARLGRWVMRRACLDSGRLSTNGAAKVAVNVSAQELAGPGFLRHLEQCLSLPGLRPGALEVELTESALAKDIDLLRHRLTQVRSLGVSICVDDFGTGYSSLSYLSQLPVDVIKVDRVFVTDFDDGGKSIIKAALGIARDFGREVIIEGVETEEMLQRVREIGASLVQGYLFARPMPVLGIACWQTKFRPPRS